MSDETQVAAASPTGDSDERSPQQRFEESRPGRVAISAFLLLTLLAILVWNLPAASELRRAARPLIAPYLTTTGLNQSWRLFAPNPRQTSREIYARLEYDDGTDEIWLLPSDDLLGSYRTYRWRKWAEEMRQDDNSHMWAPTARYLAAIHVTADRSPVRVTLVRRWAPVPELGSGDLPEWQEFEFYEYEPGSGS